MIRLFARHPTAANILMALMVVAGLIGVSRLNTELLPDFDIERITIAIAWPGASAEDIDNSIVQVIEPEIRFLDSVSEVRSVSKEGAASIGLKYAPGTDMQAALAQVQSVMSRITSLPVSSERPSITRAERYESLYRLAVSGEIPETALKAYTKNIRDDLLALGIDTIAITGNRDEEILVEVYPETLLRLDLTISEIAEHINAALIDTPLGVAGGQTEHQLRSLGRLKDADSVAGIEMKSLPNGQKIHLGDVALITETFDPDQAVARSRGIPATILTIQRRVGSDALEMSNIVKRYLNEDVPQLPRALKIEPHLANADLLSGRISLLIRNAIGGLLLVLIILYLFLNSSVALWVAFGIPVSIMAAFGVMALTGQSINMISLFGIIMVVGIVVDDAIIVGEHVESRYRQGMSPLEAAVTGAERMLGPVVGASLTTIAAFIPLMAIGDVIGQIIAAIPMVVIAVIGASLVECFLVLPGHLHHSLSRRSTFMPRFREAFDRKFEHFRHHAFRRSVMSALNARYTTVSMAIGALLLVVSLVLGGRIVFNFFPSPESDVVFANVEFNVGTPRAVTASMVDELEQALDRAEAMLTDGEGDFLRIAIAGIGRSVGVTSPEVGNHLGGVFVELLPSDEREIRTDEFIQAWRDQIQPLPGVRSLTILPAKIGPSGRPVHVDLVGGDPTEMKAASEALKRLLRRYPSISDVHDNLPYGKPELILELTAKGASLGFTTESVARQIRASFEGVIATRFARDGEEVSVRVQFGDDSAEASALDTLYLRSPSGGEVPLSEIVTLRERIGFGSIVRENGDRVVTVTGEFASGPVSLADTLASIEADGLAEIAARRGLEYSFGGKAREQTGALRDVKIGAVAALALIYLVLAWTFASYWRPLVVMSIIPFGAIGAVLGHMLLGYDLTILSVVALVGLAGIVVNDSIILISTIDERIECGEERFEAIVNGACDRLRAVILTSVTTIGGLTPLLFETSLQAQFLIPMAVTLVFGLMATTVLVLFVVPALLGIQADIGSRFRHSLGRPASDLSRGDSMRWE